MRIKKNIFGWLIWSVAALFYALDYFQHTAPSVLLRPISVSLNISVADVVSIMAIYFPVYAISQIPAGILLDRYGSKWTLSISCMVMSLGLILFATDQTLIGMFVARLIVAIGSALAFLGALKVASDVLPKPVFPIAVGFTNTICVVGGIFGQLALTYLIDKLTWQGSLWIIGYTGLIFPFVIYLCIRTGESIKDNSINSMNKFSGKNLYVLKSRNLWFLAIYAGIMFGTVVNSFSELYDVVFLEYTYRLGPHAAASVSSMIFLGIAFGGPCHGIIGRYTGKKLWMTIANITTIVILVS